MGVKVPFYGHLKVHPPPNPLPSREGEKTFARGSLDCGYRIDIVVNDLVIVEMKTVEKLLPIHDAQLLTY